MQSAKNAAASVKESAANMAATARAGLDNTKATMQEKVERMSSDDPMERDMATQRKEGRINQAEFNKQEARDHNAAARQAAAAGGMANFSTGGGTQNHNYSTAGNNRDFLTGSPISEYGTGHRPGNISDNLGGSQHRTGANPGTGRNPLRYDDAEWSLGSTRETGLDPLDGDAEWGNTAGTGRNPVRDPLDNDAGFGGGGRYN